MNPRQIEVFRAIMVCGSVTDAARMLGASQPTLTKILRHTEDQLGFRLFRREHGRLFPSEEAQLLFVDADRIFRELQSFQRLSIDLKEGIGGVLRIGATASLALSVVAEALDLYRREYPNVHIISHMLAGSEMAEMILAHQLDVGVSVAPIDVPSARTKTIDKVEVICIMPENHPLAALDTVTPHDIGEHTLISYSSATPVGQLLDGAFRQAGRRRRVDIEVSLSPIACSLVQRGIGIALVDGFVSRLATPGIVWRKFRPKTMQDVILITPPTPSHFAAKFVTQLHRAIDGSA